MTKKSAGQGFDWTGQPETCIVLHPVLPFSPSDRESGDDRTPETLLAEAEGLAKAIDLDVLEARAVRVSKISPGYLIGEGNREEIRLEVENLKPNVVIVNHTLSPVQQRNLERLWQVKVIDRTGLILEIFGARAQTKEGKLQVDLAMLSYQRSRLVRSWTHLERQRGGGGFMGGPGETQLEIDRRMIDERILHLKDQLEHVRKTRDLQRKSRERVPFPVVALVGYTNAGKSTLFNTLTGAEVFAENLLFATLDPTMRRLELPGGREVILSDTVGFISNLPTHLVAAFRATLEQVQFADVILHVRDISSPDSEAQRGDVIRILKDLGVDYDSDDRVVEVLNKIDLVADADRTWLRDPKLRGRQVAVSALSGEGLNDLGSTIEKILSRSHQTIKLVIPATEGKALAWIHSHANVLKREDRDDIVVIEVVMDAAEQEKFHHQFPHIKMPT
jgi:GTP-binding protein HflX